MMSRSRSREDVRDHHIKSKRKDDSEYKLKKRNHKDSDDNYDTDRHKGHTTNKQRRSNKRREYSESDYRKRHNKDNDHRESYESDGHDDRSDKYFNKGNSSREQYKAENRGSYKKNNKLSSSSESESNDSQDEYQYSKKYEQDCDSSFSRREYSLPDYRNRHDSRHNVAAKETRNERSKKKGRSRTPEYLKKRKSGSSEVEIMNKRSKRKERSVTPDDRRKNYFKGEESLNERRKRRGGSGSPDDRRKRNSGEEENLNERRNRKERNGTPDDRRRKRDMLVVEEEKLDKRSKRKDRSRTPNDRRKRDFREDNLNERRKRKERSGTPDDKREREMTEENELHERNKRKERSKTPNDKRKNDFKEGNLNEKKKRKERTSSPDERRRKKDIKENIDKGDENFNRKEKSRIPDDRRKRDLREEKDFNERRKRKERSRTPEYVKRKKVDSKVKEKSERITNRETSGDTRKSKTDVSDKPGEENTSKSAADTPQDASVIPASQKKTVDILTSRTGGAYIPPAKLRMMQAEITDKSSAAYQRIAWEALKKSIHGHINKVNTSNIGIIVRELFKENVVRGRGLLSRSIIQAQAASPTFTHVYAALVAVINSKFPNIGELLLKRLVIQFRRGFKRNDKSLCISSATFIAHLVNQRVAHEILALEILTLLVESPSDDSVEVAIAFLKECGMKLMEVSNKGVHAIFEMLRNILHEGKLDKRVQYMIEVIFQVRKDEFRDHVAVLEELDLVEEEDQFTHLITLDEATNPEDLLNVFKFDEEYEQNEAKYTALRKEILDEDSDSSEDGSGSEDEEDELEESENEESKDTTIIDNTETNLIALRRTIYLTIHSSLDFEECAHKLLRMELKPGQEIELCHMFLDCCAEQRTYEKFFGLLAQRFCQINKIYIPPFQQIFKDTYDTIHRLDTNKLRNVAKFFAHLLFTDAISWEVLSFIHLNEEETTSSSRIFIKILFQELCEYMGLTKLNTRIKDPTLQIAFDGLFPRDNPKNTRFAINFFTSIGLGGLTDELREHLKSQPKTPVVPKLMEALAAESTDSSDLDSDPDSDKEDTNSSDEESDEEPKKKNSKVKISKKKKKHSRSDSDHKSDKSRNSSKHGDKKKKRNKR